MGFYDFLEELIFSHATSYVNELVEFLKNNYKEKKYKRNISNADNFRSSLTNYLQQSYDTYYKCKTLLYRDKPVPMKNFYENLFLAFQGKIIPTNNIDILFKSINYRCAVIEGVGGMGKTTLLKHLLLNSIETNFSIPVFIELRNLRISARDNMVHIIYNYLKESGFDLEYEHFKLSLNYGRYVFLFDGFDEYGYAL